MKYKLTDIAFLLIARFDTVERLENALLVSEYLVSNYDTNIYFWDVASHKSDIFPRLMPKGIKYLYKEDSDPILHRTRYINDMVSFVSEKYVAVWDVDIIIPVNQVLETMDFLRKGADFAYPYDKSFCDMSYEIRNIYIEQRSVNKLIELRSFMNELYNPNPVGGAFFANRLSYIDSGLENTLFYGWGIEDGERYMRWLAQKRIIRRSSGPLFHLSHPRGINSIMQNQDSALNKKRLFFSTIRGQEWKDN